MIGTRCRFLARLVIAVVVVFIPSSAFAQVWVDVSPGGGTYSSASLSVTVSFCSDAAPIVSRQIMVNGNDETSSFGYSGGVSGCTYGQAYTGTISLQPGENSVYAQAWDSWDNWGSGSGSYTLSTAQHSIAYDSRFRDPNRCVASCFVATAAYSTPTFVTVDAARGVSLIYRHDRAKPVATVEIDASDVTPSGVQMYSLSIRRPDWSLVQFVGGLSEAYFTANSSVTRLAVQFDASGLATGAYDYTAVVRTHFYGGAQLETTLPARVMVVNDQASPFGAGWDLAEMQRATIQSDGVMIASGDGSVSFFETCSGACQLTSPAGDLSKLTRQGDYSYIREYPDGTKFLFNTVGRLTNIQDRFGNGPSYSYDAYGRVYAITVPPGVTINVAYDGNGRLSSITTPNTAGTPSRPSLFAVDGSNDLWRVTDPDNVVSFSATYTNHRLMTLTDRRGGVWTHSYASDWSLASVAAPQIYVGTLAVNPTTQFAAPGRAILQLLAQGYGQDNSPISASLDLRASVTNPRGYTTYFAVNRWGSPTQTVLPGGAAATAAYNGSGLVTQTVGVDGHTVNYTWSGPNLIQVQDVTANRTVSTTYDGANRPLTISGDGPSRTFTYPDSRTITVQTASIPATVIKLDSYGRDSLVIDAGGHVTVVYVTPSGHRNTDSVRTGIRVTRYRYDTYGRGVATVDPEERRDSVLYDLIGRTIASIDGLNRVTTYAYDSLYLRSVTSARGQVTSFIRNALGWATQENRPGSNPLYAFYDKNGNIDSTINRRGQVVKFTYDALDRLSSRLADGQYSTYGYQNASSSVNGYSAGTNAEGTDTIYVNSAGRITNAVARRGSNWYRNSYTYDTHGRVSSLGMTSNKWSDLKAQYWGFSGTGALNTIDIYGQGNFSRTVLNPGSGNEDIATTISYFNGVTLTRTLGSAHRALEDQYNSGLQSSFGVKIRTDESGRITQRATAVGDTVRGFAYETGTGRLGALRKAISPGCNFDSELGYECWASATIVSQETFTYDAVGNQLTGITQLDTVRNRVLQTNQFSFTYDADGNLISKVGSGFNQTLEWNSLGQLTRVTTNSVITDFAYDAFGRRVRKTHSGTTTGFLWGGNSLLIELDNSGGAVAEYDYFGLDRPHSMRKGGQHYYFAQDPVAGNVRGLFRHSDAAVVAQYSYQAFGQLEGANSFDDVGNALRFGAREFDSETGLYFHRSRYYDAAIGRFISEDPIGLAGGINLYAYAGNDPVNFADPMGLCIVAQSSSTTPPSSGFPTLASVSAEQPCQSPTTPRMPRTAKDDPIMDDGPGEESGGGGGSTDPDPGKQAVRACRVEIGKLAGTAFLEFAGLGPSYVTARAAVKAYRHKNQVLALAHHTVSIPWSSGIRQGNAAVARKAAREFSAEYAKGVAANYSFTYGYNEFFDLGHDLLDYLPLPFVGLGLGAIDVYEKCWNP